MQNDIDNVLTNKGTPFWEKLAILVSAFAAIIAASVSIYQGYKVEQSLELQRATVRPFLMVEPASSSLKESTIQLVVKNTGHVPGRIIFEHGRTLIGGQKARTGIDGKTSQVIYPGEPVNLVHVILDDPGSIKEGKADLIIQLCAVYEGVEEGDPRRWVLESWFNYNPSSQRLEIVNRDEKIATHGISECSVPISQIE